ncbi:MAG: hypothetical protein M3010_03155 [Candidatus Dormibacteraeota bacterium]|nr:hypothetical protein [Candidatus Dormibacteraeota bacterium]
MSDLQHAFSARRLSAFLAVALLAAAAAVAVVPAPGASAQGALSVGIPVVVDPIRGAGEPDLAVDSANNSWISGPGGTGTQTSFFWHSRDGGYTYQHQGPRSAGHWLCPTAGGGDSLNVIDNRTNEAYLTDQEALASVASAKVNALTGAFSGGSPKCTTTPAFTADRPFEGVLDPDPALPTKAPQYVSAGKPLVYMSWLCAGCGAASFPNGPGGLALAYSTDGATFYGAEPGASNTVPVLGQVVNTIQGEGTTIPAQTHFSGHGPTVVDPVTGNVFTPMSCSSGQCDGAAGNHFGFLEGIPPLTVDPTDPGKLGSLAFHTAADRLPDGVTPIPDPGQLFPVMAIDSARTLYEMWVEGDGSADPTLPLVPSTWHLYYTYSKITNGNTPDPHHTHWSTPVRVDSGADTATTDFGWFAVGDPGKLAFIWLGTDKREHPSLANPAKLWHPFMAVTTNGDTSTPTFQQTRVGLGPNHISDMCLSGTVGCITSVGNRNMADFISVDIGPDGAAQMTWANDANQLHTLPTTLIPGLPVTQAARQVSGPRLRGSGDVVPSPGPGFSAVPTTAIGDFPADAAATGDAADPRDPSAAKVPHMDLLGSSVTTDGTNLLVHMPVADLSDLSSPSPNQANVWWLTRWQFKNKIYFAKAESDAGGAPSFTAGAAKSFDRPGLNAQTVATLVDFQGGGAVQGAKVGNEWVVTVPPAAVNNPTTNDVLEQVTAYAITDNGNPLAVGPCAIAQLCGVLPNNNIPTIFDATADYNALLGKLPPPPTTGSGASPTPSSLPDTAVTRALPLSWDHASRLGLATLLVLLAVGALALRRRAL